MSSKIPSPAEKDEKFAELVESGLDFLVQASQELEENQKYSILHFSTGLELLLKARLFAEHWSLVASSPHSQKCTWPGLISGETRTLSAKELCPAITRIAGTKLSQQKKIFEEIFDHRNSVVHWIPDDEIENTAAEQCGAGYHLLQLLTGEWRATFEDFSTEIRGVEQQFREYQTYLQTRYEALEDKLKGPANDDRLTACPACKFESAVLTYQTDHFGEFECWVCEIADFVGRFHCEQWLVVEELPEQCTCGEEHTLIDYFQQDEIAPQSRYIVLDLISPRSSRSPKERATYGSPDAYCGECLSPEKTVKPVREPYAGDYICAECGGWFGIEDLDECGHCHDPWAGLSLDDSAPFGCEHCNGLVGHHMSKSN